MYRFIYLPIAGVLFGVWWRTYINWGVWLPAAIVLIAALCVALGLYSREKLALLAALVLFAFSLGVVRTEYAHRTFENGMTLVPEAALSREGLIVREPDVRDGRVLYTVEFMGERTQAPTRIRITAASQPRFSFGDTVFVSGTVRVPERFETDGGRYYNYPGFLRKEGVHYVMTYPSMQLVEAGERTIRGTLYEIKNAWLTGVGRVMVEPGAALVGGLVVGAKRSLGEGWLERFRSVGLVHIVVLSGFNLTIIAIAIRALLGALSPRVALILSGLSIILFTLMVGASASVVRASIMALLGLLALYGRRRQAVFRALAFAACGMVLYAPFILTDDSGFQLSVCATAGLIILAPRLLAYLAWVPQWLGAREIVAATISTQVAVLPLLIYHMGDVSLVALPANLLVLPTIPLAMLLGFLAGSIGMISSVIAYPFALAAHVVTSYIFLVARTLADVPYAIVEIPQIGAWAVLALYGIAASVWWYTERSQEDKQG